MSLIGIYDHPKAARMAYFGLYAQQHRGQQSAGIVTRQQPKNQEDCPRMFERRGMGLVPDVFSEADLEAMPGNIAIGHVCYSRHGKPELRNAEPFRIQHGDLDLSIAHNGALVNSKPLRKQLEKEGAIFHTTTDSENFAHLIVYALRDTEDLAEAIKKACLQVKGAYCLVILANNQLYAVRDPHGIKPLELGRVGETLVVASESCAFDLLEADDICSIEPGEILCIDSTGMRKTSIGKAKRCSHCVFELVYFARPDSVVFGEEVYSCRKRMGMQVAKEAPANADCVMPLPDSGVYFALGFAQGSHLPYEHAMIRNHYVGRTFIQPTQEMRSFDVRIKLNPVRTFIKGKRVVIAVDSIVRGTTVRGRTRHLREVGAKEVHFRVSSPPVLYPCLYGVDFPSREELVAVNQTPEQIREYIGLDSLYYLSMEGLRSILKNPDDFCFACFNGDYPVSSCDDEAAASPCAACCGKGSKK